MSFNSNPLFSDADEQREIQLVYPRGFDHLVALEIAAAGLKPSQLLRTRAVASASLQQIYWLLMHSRLVSRVLLNLETSNKTTQLDDFRVSAESVNWIELIKPGSFYWINAKGEDGDLRSPGFGAQLIKDAVVDAFRAAELEAPILDRDAAAQIVSLRLGRGYSIALDSSRASLHQRRYRAVQGAAPVKEHLAAAVLIRAGWPELVAADAGASLLDPFCGAGTILIEAASMATDEAPGLRRDTSILVASAWHEPELWDETLATARQHNEAGRQRWTGRCQGRDEDPRALTNAAINARAAGVDDWLAFERRSAEAPGPVETDSGNTERYDLIVANPPYGERMGNRLDVQRLYSGWSANLRALSHDCRLAILSALPDVPQVMRLKADKQYKLFNGDLEVVLSIFQLYGSRIAGKSAAGVTDDPAEGISADLQTAEAPDEHEAALANRLRKNLKQIRKWAEREGITCYRIYDADIPEFSFAVDWYDGMVSLQEYLPPKQVDPVKARRRLLTGHAVVASVLELRHEDVIVKARDRQRGKRQYEKSHGDKPSPLSRQMTERIRTFGSLPSPFRIVAEADIKLYVNLVDYLDTGLFLDHRPMRAWLRREAAGKRVLNLFCYTAVASLQAAAGGAASTLSIDMSQPYLNWAAHNFALNRFSEQSHRLLHADVIEWLSETAGKPSRERFDLIFLDPPSFSNSKRMEGVLDIQRDHGGMIRKCMSMLSVGGTLMFSTNLRSFRLDPDIGENYSVEDRTSTSIPKDFARRPGIHACWHIRPKSKDAYRS